MLSGLIRDANGPWLAEALREQGVVLSYTWSSATGRMTCVARWTSWPSRLDLVMTSGGLGPTADDLTAEVVAAWAGVPMELDAALEERIWAIVDAAAGAGRWRGRADARGGAQAGARAFGRRRAGARGHGAGVPRRARRRWWSVLPGPPRELQTMWAAAVTVSPLRELLAARVRWSSGSCGSSALPEPEIAATLREIDADSLPLEITTCLRRGELEVATVFSPATAAAYAAFEASLRERHGDVLFSDDGATIDEVVARAAVRAGRWRRPSRARAG